MNLFIFSFKIKSSMIKNSLLVFGVLLAAWWMIVLLKPFSVFQHQWQENVIVAENFIFNIDNVDNLIVGSSLAKRLAMDKLPEFYNLSFSGQGIFDGLNVLKFSKKIPKNLFIEINVIGRHENTSFNNIMFSPILNIMKKKIIAFRTDKQPLAVLANFVLIPVAKKIKNSISIFANMLRRKRSINKEEVSLAKINMFDQSIELQKNIYSNPIDDNFIKILTSQVDVLTNHLLFLKREGVNIIFFEMPINRELINLDRVLFVRKKMKGSFNGFDFIELPKNIDFYKTTDGVHLKNDESIIYTEYFKNEAKKILTKQHRVLGHSLPTH